MTAARHRTKRAVAGRVPEFTGTGLAAAGIVGGTTPVRGQ